MNHPATSSHLDRRRARVITWRILVIVALGVAALFVSVTEVHAVNITSSVSGTVKHDATTGNLQVTVSLNDPTELNLLLTVVSLRHDVATLVADGYESTRQSFLFADGQPQTHSYQVKPLANGRATIVWDIRSRNGGTRYHAYHVYQVDFSGVPTPDPPIAMTTKTANNVTISEIAADPWHAWGDGNARMDHVIGDSTSLTYAVTLTANGGACPTSATVRISVSGDQTDPVPEYASRKSEVGIAIGGDVPATRTPIGDAPNSAIDLSFNACDAAQQVTVYGIPDSDDWFSKLTLNHTLTHKAGTSLEPPLAGPALKLFVFDMSTLHTPDYGSPYDPLASHLWTYFNGVRNYNGWLYIRAPRPTASGDPASDWVEFCMKIPNYQHVVAARETIPMPQLTLVPYQETWRERSFNEWRERLNLDQYAKGNVPPYEFQVFSEIVETEEGLCQTVAGSGVDGTWSTFYDGSAQTDGYKIGNVTIPQAHFGYFINVRVRGVVAKRTNLDGRVVETWPDRHFGDRAQLVFGIAEFHLSFLARSVNIASPR